MEVFLALCKDLDLGASYTQLCIYCISFSVVKEVRLPPVYWTTGLEGCNASFK